MGSSTNTTGRKKDPRKKESVAPISKGRRDFSEKESAGEAGTEVLLRHMTPHQKGIIAKVIAHGELGRRIRDMGLVPGIPVEIKGRAPLKDPVAIRIRDFTLTLRNNEADQIVMRVEE